MKQHLPLVALVGRPNVGKSTLFNRLIKRRVSITHDMAGVTRDSIYSEVRGDTRSYALVDTGGLVPGSSDEIEMNIVDQAREAMAGADLILFVVDGRTGLHPQDDQVGRFLRQSGKEVRVVVNKVDGPDLEERMAADFYALGFPLDCVSSSHGYGMGDLRDMIERSLPPIETPDEAAGLSQGGLKIALLGRPNAGKSSLVNAVLRQNRLMVSDMPGTTRDAVDVTFEAGGKLYTFVDTAGVRRRANIEDSLERFTVSRALSSSKRADVTLLVLDGQEGLSRQDKRLISFLDGEKTPFCVLVNKIDLIPKNDLPALRKHFQDALVQCPHVPILYTSTVTRAGLGGLLPLVERLKKECALRVGTGQLNRAMREAIERHQPPMVQRRRAKFYYLTQADEPVPTFIFFVNNPELIKQAYIRYLENSLRKIFTIRMAPLNVVFRSSHERKDGD